MNQQLWLSTIASVFVVAVPLNYAWEMAQAVLYQPMGSVAHAAWRCFVASVGDGGLIVLTLVAGCLIYRRPDWFTRSSSARIVLAIVIAAVIGVAVEAWGVRTGQWVYNERMPRVPVLQLGLVPLLQMPVLTTLTFWISAQWLNRRARPQV